MHDAAAPASGAVAPAMPLVGDPAPDFALPDDEGVTRRLDDARGRWLVLFFYPKDDTPGCTVEVCEFRDTYADLHSDGAEIWGVSTLDSASKARFKEKHALPYPLLADEDHAVSEAYGTWVEKKRYGTSSMGVKRATFLVDPDGRVAHVWPSVTPEGHAAEVRAELERARAAAGT